MILTNVATTNGNTYVTLRESTSDTKYFLITIEGGAGIELNNQGNSIMIRPAHATCKGDR